MILYLDGTPIYTDVFATMLEHTGRCGSQTAGADHIGDAARLFHMACCYALNSE